MELKPKRCEFCGKIFIPHRCVGQRQRACNDEKCKQERKENSQTQWCENNPNYFKGRYPELKDKIQSRQKKLKLKKQNTPPTIQDGLTINNNNILIALEDFLTIQDKLTSLSKETNRKIYQLKIALYKTSKMTVFPKVN